jgi:hypothetical protein
LVASTEMCLAITIWTESNCIFDCVLTALLQAAAGDELQDRETGQSCV